MLRLFEWSGRGSLPLRLCSYIQQASVSERCDATKFAVELLIIKVREGCKRGKFRGLGSYMWFCLLELLATLASHFLPDFPYLEKQDVGHWDISCNANARSRKRPDALQ